MVAHRRRSVDTYRTGPLDVMPGCSDGGGMRSRVGSQTDIFRCLVDCLARTDLPNSAPTRAMMIRRIEANGGPKLYLADTDVSRDWLFLLVQACGEDPDGLAAMVGAVEDLRPGAAVVSELRRVLADRVVDTDDPDPDAAAMKAAAPGSPEPLTPAEIQLLASLYGAGSEAAHVLVDVGLRPGQIPLSARNGESFWTQVSEAFAQGLVRDGRRRVLAAAARDFPANPSLGLPGADPAGD